MNKGQDLNVPAAPGDLIELGLAWDFFAGMSEGEIRTRQAEEQVTGGRPTWQFKASRASREAAAWQASPCRYSQFPCISQVLGAVQQQLQRQVRLTEQKQSRRPNQGSFL